MARYLFSEMKFAHYTARYTKAHAQVGRQGLRLEPKGAVFFTGGAINLHPIQPAAAEHNTQISVTQQAGAKQPRQQNQDVATTRQRAGVYLGWYFERVNTAASDSTVEVDTHTHTHLPESL